MSYTLVPSQNAKRVKITTEDISYSVPVLIGNPAETWVVGTYIEIVRGTVNTDILIEPYDISVTINYLNNCPAGLYNIGEYCRVCLVSPGVWDLTLYQHVYAPENEVLVGLTNSYTSTNAFTFAPAMNRLGVNYPVNQDELSEIRIYSSNNYNAFGHAEFIIGSATAGSTSSIEMTAGAHMGVNAGGLQAGNINITGGYAAFGSKGGRVQIYGGEADPIGSEFNSWAIGGAVDIQSGRSLGVGLYGSNVNINGGYSSDNTGGTVYISGGEAGSNSSAAGSIVLSSGNQNVASADIGMGGVFISSDVRGEGLPQALVVNSKGAIGFIPSFSHGVDPTILEGYVQSANYGVVGQVLKTNARLAQVAWENPVFKPAPQIVYNLSVATPFDFGASSHHNVYFRATYGGGVSIVVQPDSAFTGTEEYWQNDIGVGSPAAMPIGGVSEFITTGAMLTFSAGAGVTINTPSTLTVSGAYKVVKLIKIAPNTWDITGGLDP
jgi:hypothetical protein